MPTIDSSGIGMLVRYLKQSGGSVRLVKPSKFVSQTLKMVGVLNLFSSYEDLSDAIASLQ
jgi:anti-anti-sigma factor